MKQNSFRSISAFFYLRALAGLALLVCAGALVLFALKSKSVSEPERAERDMPIPGEVDGSEASRLNRLEQMWNDRLTYPTGKFDPAWVRAAADQHNRMQSARPAGSFAHLKNPSKGAKTLGLSGRLAAPIPSALSTTTFTALGPQPEQMTGCTGCFNYALTEGRVNAIAIDPTTITNGSIVAYAGTVGGGVWKTTNCCSSSATWTSTTDDPLISTTAIDTLTIDPNNHNTIYAGTGDLNYGSFSMGSQGILKSTDGGAHWVVLGANVFNPGYTEPAGQFPQYDAVGKVRVDPNNSNNVVAGTKKGLWFSYDAGNNWTGPCTTNSFSTQRQDITGLELSNMGGGVTRVLAAIGVRGFATTVQYDLGNNGANGLYTANMQPSGCPTFTSISSDSNGFVFGTAVTGSPYGTGGQLHAGSGTAYVSTSSTTNVGDQLGRIDIAVAPSDPNTIYAQVQSIAPNSNTGSSTGCASANGCQLGAFVTTNGGTSWTFMAGSAGGSLRSCGSSGNANGTNAGDYPQNWYDQQVVVDPNDSTRVFFDTLSVYFATQGGSTWYDTSCAYTQTGLGMHADQHVLTFVPGSSSILLAAGDGSVDGTTNANVTALNTARPTWFHMTNGMNTIEFYSGDISANFANSAAPSAVGGAQDNGPSSVLFSGSPTGPAQWQMGLGGDGFSGLINSGGTGPTSAQGTITLVTGGSTAGQTFQIGSQTFTWVASGTATGQVVLNSSTTTEGNNLVTSINRDIGGLVTAVRSGATVVVTATLGGAGGNSITFVNNNSSNFSVNGSGTLGATASGGGAGTTQPVFYEGNNSGGFSRCVNNCTIGGASWSSKQGGWTGDTQQFNLPVHIFHGGIPGGDDCPNAACGHLLAGTTRVWETVTGNNNQTNSATIWYVTNNPATQNLTKQSLGNRSFITQVKYSPKYSSVAIVSTNDGNVQIGFNMGAGTPASANWVDVTGANAILPNRPILGCALDPSVSAANVPVGYAAVGGFNANTPTTLGHVFQVTCAANCASSMWANKTGNLPDIPVDSVIVNPNYPQQVFAGSDWGVYFTNNITVASPVWYRFDAGLPHTMIWDMAIDRGSTTLSVWTRGRGAWVFPLTASDITAPPQLVSASSRMTHGAAGTFDFPLALNGSSIEPRSDGTGNYTIVLNFDQPVSSGTASTNGPTASNVTFSGNSMIVSLTGVADASSVTVNANNVLGTFSLGSGSISLSFLLGDVNADKHVNVGDTIMVRNNSGATLDNTNFQDDVNVDGMINVGDTIVVRNHSGDFLP